MDNSKISHDGVHDNERNVTKPTMVSQIVARMLAAGELAPLAEALRRVGAA